MADIGVNKNLGIAAEELVLSSSPRLSKAAFETVKKTEESGISLNFSWTFWLDKYQPGVSNDYEQSLKRIFKVGTVQGFWSVFNNIPDVGKLKHGYTYHLMKDDRRPVWEDEQNASGGTWKFKCSKFDSPEVWKELLLAVIGEQLSDCVAEGDEIIGASVNVRERDDVIQLWNKVSHKHERATVVQKIETLLPNVSFLSVFYKEFQANSAFRSKQGGSQY